MTEPIVERILKKYLNGCPEDNPTETSMLDEAISLRDKEIAKELREIYNLDDALATTKFRRFIQKLEK